MRRAGRRFDIYVIGMDDVERMGAWKTQDEVCFSCEESRRLRRVRKRNTFLFDALTDIAGLPYRVSEGVLEDMLYEVVLVDFDMKGHVRCLEPKDRNRPKILPAAELQETLYEKGFCITSLQGREIRFVPFIASASMSREEEYLFVNSERLDQLLRAVTLDMVSTDPGAADKYVPVLNGAPAVLAEDAVFGGLNAHAKVANVPKLAAYMGLALSDGVSLRERWAAQQTGPLPQLDEQAWSEQWMLGLNADNTVCVGEWNTAPMLLDNFDFCWVNEEAPRRAKPLSVPSVSTQTAAQTEMTRLFDALMDRAAFDALTDDDWAQISAAWESALDAFMKDPASLRLRASLIPPPRSGKLGKGVHWYALIYAMCLCRTEGKFIVCADGANRKLEQSPAEGTEAADVAVTPDGGDDDEDDDEDDGAQVTAAVAAMADELIPIGELKRLISTLRTDAGLRGRVWGLLHEQSLKRRRLIEVTPAGCCTRVTLFSRPCARFRAKLRRIEEKERLNRGNQYDGCGFLDDSLFDLLETQLRGGPRPADEEPLNAVQIRLPWCKGLLVRFSVTKYFRAWALERGYSINGLQICDVFGSHRRVFDEQGKPVLKAVFTTAMFKGAGWFRELALRDAQAEYGDRWGEYWRRLRAHGASLLIAGRNTPPGMTSRLNYQFLSTLGFTQEQLYQLIMQRMETLSQAQQGVSGLDACRDKAAAVRRMARLLGMVSEETEEEKVDERLAEAEAEAEDEEDTQDPAQVLNAADDAPEQGTDADYLSLLARALEDHPEALTDTAYIHGRFRSLVQGEVLQLMRGRVPVLGDVRYLLPDLLQMVRYMAKHFLRAADGRRLSKAKGAAPELTEEEREDCRSTRSLPAIAGSSRRDPFGYYYAPGENAPWIAREGNAAGQHLPVAILRNPHYAMGEEPVLQPLGEKERAAYERWFSGLRGCVMASPSVMYTINGADCDGDRVNVCAQPDVVEAVQTRAGAERELLLELISRRDALVEWAAEQAGNSSLHRTVRDYMKLLRDELPAILPDDVQGAFRAGTHLPPLLYAGSTAKVEVFSKADLTNVHLRDKLWDSFRLASRQRIGMMSLDVLRLSADAYGTIPAGCGQLDSKALLGLFVARYLVVCKALDTAMEIDMAKTGLSCDRHEIKTSRQEVGRLFGYSQTSGYYIWRRLFKKYHRQIRGYHFDAQLEKLMKEFHEKWKAPESGGLLLDALPAMVYSLWAPERAARVGGLMLPAQGTEAAGKALLQETMLLPAAGASIWARLKAPEKRADSLLKQHSEGQPSMLDQIRALLIRYDRERRTSAAAQQAAESIAAAYRDVMEWLIRSGRGLDEALEAMKLLQGMLDRWHSLSGMDDACLRDVFARMQRRLRAQNLAIRWGWSDNENRAGLLDKVLAGVCKRVDATRTWQLAFTAEERDLLAGSRRSIVLAELVMTYAFYDATLRRRSSMGSAMTLEELEEGVRAIIGAAAPEGSAATRSEVYYAACHCLFGATYADATGRRLQLMSEFLLTYMLRGMLSDKVEANVGEEATQ